MTIRWAEAVVVDGVVLRARCDRWKDHDMQLERYVVFADVGARELHRCSLCKRISYRRIGGRAL